MSVIVAFLLIYIVEQFLGGVHEAVHLRQVVSAARIASLRHLFSVMQWGTIVQPFDSWKRAAPGTLRPSAIHGMSLVAFAALQATPD